MTSIMHFGFALLAGVCLYAASTHLQMNVIAGQQRVHRLFALMCFVWALGAGIAALQSPDDTSSDAPRLILGAVCIMSIIYPWFMAAYTEARLVWPALVLSCTFVVFSIANWVLPYGIWFSSAPRWVPRTAPWGERFVTFQTVEYSPWRYVFWVTEALMLLYFIWAGVAQYRRGQRRRPIVLLVVLIIGMLPAINDYLVSIGAGGMPSFGLFGFVSIVLLMSWELRREQRQFNSQMQAVLDRVPALVYVKDLRGRYTFVNQHFAQLFHRSSEQLLGRTDEELMARGDATMRSAQDRQMLRSGAPLSFDEQIECDGEQRNFLSLKFMLGERSAPSAIAGVSADITDRIRAEQALRASEVRIRLLLDSTEQGVIGIDRNGYCTFANRAASRLLSYDDAAALQGVHIDQLIPRSEARGEVQGVTALWQTLQKGERNYCAITRAQRRDGSDFAVEYWSHPIVDGDAATVGAVLSFADVSERERVNKAVHALAKASATQNSRAFFQYCARVLASMYDADYAVISLFDRPGSMARTVAAYANDAIIDDFEYDADLVPCGEIGRTHVRKLIASDLSAAYPQGWCAGAQLQSYLGTPLVSPDHAVVGVVAVMGRRPLHIGSTSESMLDVFAQRISVELDRQMALDRLREFNESLEQRVAERTKELSQINEELEAFSYSVSHDLRAPLATIAGFSGLLSEHAPDPDSKRYLQVITDNTRRMGTLIDALLSLARIKRQPINVARVDVSRLAQDTIHKLREADPQRTVQVNIAPGLYALADQALLTSVLDNLLGNAWKYTVKTPTARIEVGATDSGHETTFYVRDNGAGFDPQLTHKLFQPFQRLHVQKEFPGSGIGLATVARIVQRHGGRIWAEGALGTGACFYFTLPVVWRNRRTLAANSR